ncbi:HAD family hydrolase [Enterococcus olivae]
MIEALIFDLDGLLVDSEYVYQKGWIVAAKNLDIELSMEQTQKWNGIGLTGIQEILLKSVLSSKREFELLVEELDKYIETHLHEIKLKPYALEVLTKAKEQNLKLGLASSSFRRQATNILKPHGLHDFFDSIVTGDEVVRMKPDPEVYLKSIENLKVNVDRVFAIEDSIIGGTAATKAQLKVFLIPDQSLSNKYSIKEKSQVDIIQGASIILCKWFFPTVNCF